MKQVTKNIQKSMNKIEKWTSLWGFNLSKEKTLGIVFCHNNKPDKTEIFINKTKVKFVEQVKFLGMTLDKQLTWRPHINKLIEKTKKTLNLMRSLSGQSWGATKTTQMMIYRALIRSRIDYGCIVYNTISNDLQNQLSRIQTAALKICSGSMKGTASSALQVECIKSFMRRNAVGS